jgi:hypothetical protein
MIRSKLREVKGQCVMRKFQRRGLRQGLKWERSEG